MQEKVVQILKESVLCSHMREEDISHLLKENRSEVKVFQKGEQIFQESAIPQKIFVLLTGSVLIAKDTLSGKRMILAQITESGELFGEVYAFMEKASYDMYAQALEHTTVLTLQNTIFSSEESADTPAVRILRNNLMTIFATKAYTINRKLRVLGSSSVREKIVRFLFDRQEKDGYIGGDLSREAIADYLNVTRPSLSRELGKMQDEGILKLENRQIRVTDQEIFESWL